MRIYNRICYLLLVSVLVLNVNPITAFAEERTQDNLYIAYENIVSYAKDNGIELGMTYDDFVSNYSGETISEYEVTYYQILEPRVLCYSTYSSGGNTYYYNTGYSCPSQANYSKYNLTDVVKKGDIIYEANGGFGITGHIAIVDGVYTRSDGSKYIRLIEAISNSYGGVTRSILDDTRVDDKNVTILRVSGATASQKSNAVTFCRGEVGSSYNLDLAKDTSSSETDWYCSELVWAAYYNQGIDIEVGGTHGEPGVTPRDILNSSLTYVVPYSTR